MQTRYPAHKFLQKGVPFVDYKKVALYAGKGGDGMITFARSALHPIGPPDGGNGGRGGSIYVRSCPTITSLNGIQNKYIAANGTNGAAKNMHGKNASDLEIIVPTGTIVREIDPPKNWLPDTDPEDSYELVKKYFKFRHKYTPQQDRIEMLIERIPKKFKQREKLEIDLLDRNRVLLAKGGLGGMGNPHFVTPLIPGPGICSRGIKGETMFVEFELKTLADAGLVGLPNAGKSTLLKAISNALPKIASYPFTTLNPYVATIDFPDFWRMTLADMPGIIQGASENRGLGHRFLRHIERNSILVYVLDLSEHPDQDLDILLSELELYKPGMTKKPSLIVANKADLETSQSNLEILKMKTSLPIVPISAKDSINIEILAKVMRSLVEKERQSSNNQAS